MGKAKKKLLKCIYPNNNKGMENNDNLKKINNIFEKREKYIEEVNGWNIIQCMLTYFLVNFMVNFISRRHLKKIESIVASEPLVEQNMQAYTSSDFYKFYCIFTVVSGILLILNFIYIVVVCMRQSKNDFFIHRIVNLALIFFVIVLSICLRDFLISWVIQGLSYIQDKLSICGAIYFIFFLTIVSFFYAQKSNLRKRSRQKYLTNYGLSNIIFLVFIFVFISFIVYLINMPDIEVMKTIMNNEK